MLRRVVMALLLIWILVGLVVWLSHPATEGDGAAPGGSLALEAPDTARETRSAPRETSPAGAPSLQRTVLREPARALLARLGGTSTAAQRAQLSAWLRSHPDHVDTLMAALVEAQLNYAHGEWNAFFRDVFGSLHDLEPQLAIGLIARLDAPAPATPYWVPPAVGALAALEPLSPGTRRSLEAWVRRNARSPWAGRALALVISNAENGDEIAELVQWVLTADDAGKPSLHVAGMMASIAALGERGRSLAPDIAAYVLSQQDDYGAAVDALIAVGAGEPAAERALVALLGAGGPGLAAAHAYFEERGNVHQVLLEALKDDSARVRVAAVLALEMRHLASREELLPVILPCLQSDDALWRDKAMRMIPYRTERAEEVTPTLEAMFRSRNEQHWVTAAKTLQLLASASGDRFDVSDALDAALRHPHVGVRRLVVRGLMNYPPAAAVPMLRQALRDEDAAVREAASDGLGELAREDAGALAALREATTHQDPNVVEMAEAWLGEIEALAAEARDRKYR